MLNLLFFFFTLNHIHATGQNMNLSALTRAKGCRLGNVFSVWEASHPGMTFLHGASVVFGKTWPLHMRMPLDCKYSNKGTFPLRSYQMEKSTCLFWFALHLLHAGFFFFSTKKTETYYFVGQETDYMRVICSVFCSCSQRRASRCLLWVALNACLPFCHRQTSVTCQYAGWWWSVGNI